MDTMPNNKRLADCTLSELIQMDINPGVVSVSSEQLEEIRNSERPLDSYTNTYDLLRVIEDVMTSNEEEIRDAKCDFDKIALELKEVTKRYRVSLVRLSRAERGDKLLQDAYSAFRDHLFGGMISPEEEVELEDELPF